MEAGDARAKPSTDGDCNDTWHGKTVDIDTSTGEGGHLWMPTGSTFRITRNRDFLKVPYGGIKVYQIEYYTGDLPDVWKSIWLVDQGTQPSTIPRTRGMPVKCLAGYLPVALLKVNEDGMPVYELAADNIFMEYHPAGMDQGSTTDIVHVQFSLARESGAASGPPR